MNQDAKKIRKILITLFFFLLAGLCEIGGGYLVWLWLREDMGWILGSIGGFNLFLYGVVPTFQPSHFHRIYAAYGGIIIAGIPAKSIKHKVTSDKLFLMAGQEQKQQLTDIKAEQSSANQ